MLQTMQTNLGNQLAESLAFKASIYVQGVYDVVALKRDHETVVENRKLDYDLLHRWTKYMEKPTDKYKYKEAWQAMMKRTLAAAATGGGRGGRGGAGGAAPGVGAPATAPPATPASAPDPASTSAPATGGEPLTTPATVSESLSTPSTASETMPDSGAASGIAGRRRGAAAVHPVVTKLADQSQTDVA